MILKNAAVLNGAFRMETADIKVENGKIAEIAPGLSGGESIDLAGCTIVPGFVDIHIHGCVGQDACDADKAGIAKMAEYLIAKGVTTFCPTTMTVSHDEISKTLETVRAAMEENPFGAKIAGVNMEGPYISFEKKGAQDGRYVLNPDFAEFRHYFEECGGIIKLVDIAPECPGAEEFIQKAKELCTVSIAHTNSNYEQAKRSFDLGITHATHLYNAMSGLTHRAPGVVGAVFDDPRVRAEIICDGFHIHPAVLRVTFEALGKDRMVVISDSLRAAGEPDGVYDLGGQTVYVKNGEARLEDGTIAGSTTNLHQEVKNLVSYGVPLAEAVQAASLNPAKAIREDHRIGSIQTGKDADLVVLDQALNIRMVLSKGEVAVSN